MRVLVIPDVHLKPVMFERATQLMESKAERAVCLMDIPDNHRQQFNLELYQKTYDAAMDFIKKFPDTLWVYGNHDLTYRWRERVSNSSPSAANLVIQKQIEFNNLLTPDNPIKYVQKVDQCLFCHGGLSKEFVMQYVSPSKYYDLDYVVEKINQLGHYDMWDGTSPIWLRPQFGNVKMYMPRKCLQIVGHTPVKDIVRKGNVISTDVFSTTPAGENYGCRKFIVIDTKTWAYEKV